MHQMRWAIDNPERLREIGAKSREKIKKFNLEFYIKKLISIL